MKTRSGRRMSVRGRLLAAAGVGSVLLGMAVAACASAPPARTDACALRSGLPGAIVDAPFDIVDGRIYVSVQVNAQGPFRFAVDTGASGLARVDSRLLDRLSLRATGQARSSDGMTTAAVDTVRVQSMELGQLQHRDLDVITRDYASRAGPEAAFDGILARDFFADGLLVIDYPRKRLSFSRSASLDPESPGAMRYTRAFRVPVTLGELKTTGNLDTGANVSFVLPQAIHAGLEAEAAQHGGRAQLTNGHMALQQAKVAGPFEIGQLRLTNVEVKVSQTYPEVLIGAYALQDAVVLIDQRAEAVAVCSAWSE